MDTSLFGYGDFADYVIVLSFCGLLLLAVCYAVECLYSNK